MRLASVLSQFFQILWHMKEMGAGFEIHLIKNWISMQKDQGTFSVDWPLSSQNLQATM